MTPMHSSSALDPPPHHSSQTRHSPWHVLVRYIVYAMITTIILALGNLLIGDFHFYKLNGFVLVGLCVVAWWWIGESVWRSTVAPMLGNSPVALHYLTRIPFWYMTGGIGYTLGLLIVQKVGIFYAYDIPIKPIFLFGGIFGVGMQSVIHSVAFWKKRTHAAHSPVMK